MAIFVWLLLGSGVVLGLSRDQAGDQGTEQGFAASARVVHELKKAAWFEIGSHAKPGWRCRDG